jgi:hypothetical protein
LVPVRWLLSEPGFFLGNFKGLKGVEPERGCPSTQLRDLCTSFSVQSNPTTYAMYYRMLLPMMALLMTTSVSAQMEQTIYQIFPTDSARTVHLDIVDSCNIIPWAGDNVLAEIRIRLWDCSPEILDYLIKQERYAVLSEQRGEAFWLSSKDKKRKEIRNKQRITCPEVVEIKLFVPDYYEWTLGSDGTTILNRKD